MEKAFVVHRKVRFGDCDPGGILYTPRIGHFIVEALIDFISACFNAPAERSMFELGIAPPARAFSVEFLKPMVWDDDLMIHVRLKEIRNSAFVFSLNGFVKDDKVFSSEFTQVCVDPESMRPVPVPEKMREVLENYKGGAEES
ncbi:MAG: acyl-CoA thioesterase [Saprospiraceae bacterium]|nr:acyl-CoA thioesterase [Saprospiraceae bacterium]